MFVCLHVCMFACHTCKSHRLCYPSHCFAYIYRTCSLFSCHSLPDLPLPYLVLYCIVTPSSSPQDPNRPRDVAGVGDNTNTNFEKKRDICIGFLILSAIVYVLARAGGAGSCEGMVPIDSLPQGSSSSQSFQATSSSSESTRIKDLEAQIAELKRVGSSAAVTTSSSNSPAVFDIDSYRENVRRA